MFAFITRARFWINLLIFIVITVPLFLVGLPDLLTGYRARLFQVLTLRWFFRSFNVKVKTWLEDRPNVFKVFRLITFIVWLPIIAVREIGRGIGVVAGLLRSTDDFPDILQETFSDAREPETAPTTGGN